MSVRDAAERDEVSAWSTWLSGRLLQAVGDRAELQAALAETAKCAAAAEAERDELKAKAEPPAPPEGQPGE